MAAVSEVATLELVKTAILQVLHTKNILMFSYFGFFSSFFFEKPKTWPHFGVDGVLV